MKQITKEQIDEVIAEEIMKISENVHNDYFNAIEKIPEDLKQNPLMYNIIAISIAQGNAISVIRETLYKLLVE